MPFRHQAEIFHQHLFRHPAFRTRMDSLFADESPTRRQTVEVEGVKDEKSHKKTRSGTALVRPSAPSVSPSASRMSSALSRPRPRCDFTGASSNSHPREPASPETHHADPSEATADATDDCKTVPHTTVRASTAPGSHGQEVRIRGS